MRPNDQAELQAERILCCIWTDRQETEGLIFQAALRTDSIIDSIKCWKLKVWYAKAIVSNHQARMPGQDSVQQAFRLSAPALCQRSSFSFLLHDKYSLLFYFYYIFSSIFHIKNLIYPNLFQDNTNQQISKNKCFHHNPLPLQKRVLQDSILSLYPK